MGEEHSLVWNELEGCFECTNCNQYIGKGDYKVQEGWSYCPGCGCFFEKVEDAG